jgi:protein-S-isoprenylcysteine O-methyltransferase Ste14
MLSNYYLSYFKRVISTGPYAVVRHPMCLALLFIYGFRSLALDSYWALPHTLILIILSLVFGVLNEEKVLTK